MRLKTPSPPGPPNSGDFNWRHPSTTGPRKKTDYWTHGLENHVPHPTNAEQVSQTTRFGHVLTMVSDAIRGEPGWERTAGPDFRAVRLKIDTVLCKGYYSDDAALKAPYRQDRI